MKVFGIGLQRTGLMSLTMALNMIDVKTIQFPKELFYDRAHSSASQYDGFTDFPIPLYYQELDQLYPESKFVYTIRDTENWLRSAQWLFTVGRVKFNWDAHRIIDQIHESFYGVTRFDEKNFRRKFEAHHQSVTEYFSRRPDDFLVFDARAGLGFSKLCQFLEKPIPTAPYPHVNNKEPKWRVLLRKKKYQLKKLITKIVGAPQS